jgi:hypothetical protein
MMQMFKPLCVALAVVASPAVAESRSAALADLLSHLPASMITPQTLVQFADLAAARQVTAPNEATARWGMFARANLAGMGDAVIAGMEGQWPALVGFGPDDLIAVLAVDAPPEHAILARLTDTTGVGSALLASGYAQTDVAGTVAFVRGDDFVVDIAARDVADPFGHGLGLSSRVAVQDTLLLQSSGTAWLTAMLAAPSDPTADMAVLLAALDDPASGSGAIVKATLMPDQAQIAASHGGIPPWHKGIMADISDGTANWAVVAVSYPDRTVADRAAGLLTAAWDATPLPNTNTTLATILGVTPVVRVTGNGPFAVVLVAQTDIAVQNGFPINRGYDVFFSAMMQRAFAPFGPE